MPRKGERKPFAGEIEDPEALIHWLRRFVEYLRIRNYAERTLITTDSYVRLFIEWADDRGLTRPSQVTKPVLEAYQRWLFYFRKKNGKPLTFVAQRSRLHKLRVFFKWLSKDNVILSNPASDLEMPRVEKRLPRAVLTEREMERVLVLPDTTDALGLRDRAMMEVLYSTGIRRNELRNLEIFDVDPERGTLTVNQGKGRKDRVVPIGERALEWVAKYLATARPELVAPPDHPTLFLNERGDKFDPVYLTHLIAGYVAGAKLGKTGACHLFRHTMATLMLEGGADVRHIQEILGHVQLSTTAIYTRVSIRHLKAVHEATHPGARTAKATPAKTQEGGAEVSEQALLTLLAAEAAEEVETHPEGKHEDQTPTRRRRGTRGVDRDEPARADRSK